MTASKTNKKQDNGSRTRSSRAKGDNLFQAQEEIVHLFQKNAEQFQEKVKDFNPFAEKSAQMYREFQEKMMGQKQTNYEQKFQSSKQNVESLQDAGKMAFEVMRQITELQSKFIQQAFDDMTDMLRENLQIKHKTPQEYFARQGERMHHAVSRAMEHSGKVSDIVLESNQELFKNVKSQFDEGMKELHTYMSKMKH
ncbi:MAG: phasin family protein [Alphaproteobacteria bacterium]|nr:phasin family protein [Alphaproteobacteria bacterium]